MTTNDPTPRRFNCAALRTLHDLERTLQRHIAELHAVDCEDLEAADAIVFAIEAAEQALDKARVVRRGTHPRMSRPWAGSLHFGTHTETTMPQKKTIPPPADRDALRQMGSAISRCLQDLAAIETDDASTDDLLEAAYVALERWMNQCAACVQRLKTTEPPCTNR